MPADLKKRAEEAAEQNHRSLNAEIVQRVEDSFKHAPIGNNQAVIDIMTAHDIARAILATIDEKKAPISDDELALVRFWRSLSEEKKRAVVDLLHIDKVAF